MRRQSRGMRIAVAAALAAVLLFPAAARAGDATKQLQASISQLVNVLGDPGLKGEEKKAERRAKIRAIVSKRFDFEEMARRSLASHWRRRTPEERKEFVALFSHLLERSYIGKIEQYNNETIRYGKEAVDEEFATVQTQLISKNQSIDIQYRLHKNGGQWMVYDVIVEDVSLVKNYRDQFRTILRKSSFSDLVEKLRAKQDAG